MLTPRLCTLFFLAIACAAVSPTQAGKPNIVVILVDDMGYGDPGCFNPDSKIATPHIDRIAAEGMKFTDAHAPGPLCHMSRYGLLTGRYPFRTNVNLWRRQPLIVEGQMTIASLAKSQGYSTAMVGKWHCGFDESNGYDNPLPGGPADRGFDSFFGIRASTDIPPYFYIRNDRAVMPPSEQIEANSSEGWSPIQGAFWRRGGISPDLKLEEVTPKFTDEAIQVIERHAKSGKEKPLMLYLAYPSPHTPWLPAEKYVGKSGAGMFGDFMMNVDAEIGRVLAALDKAKMKDTLLVFTADNGPVWYDQDVEKFEHDSAGPLRGMKADAWEAGHRMPFIVRWPGKVSSGSSSDQVICFTDLLATFADVLNVDLTKDQGPDSFSFLSVLQEDQSPTDPIRGSVVMSPGAGESMMMIRSGRWKLIKGLGSGGFSKPKKIKATQGEPVGQLYDLENDLAETQNLYNEKPQVVKRLLAEMERIVGAESSKTLE
ncbi:MAG: arylsulfatase [Planctomycetota bacterium]